MGFLLETVAEHPDPLTPWLVGGSALLIMLILLQIVRGIGKSRPHA